MRFQDIPQFTRANYEVDIPWLHLKEWLGRTQNESTPINMNPVYQRGHVWTIEQQSRFVEFCLRGGMSARDIYWNCSSWMKGFNTPLELVDGLQRITAVNKFLGDEITAFGYRMSEYEDTLRMLYLSTCFRFHIADLQTQDDVIQWYLDLNYAGTPHTDDELERVRTLMSDAVKPRG